MNSALYLVPEIIGAKFLDWWAVTHSLNDGCFQANIPTVLETSLPYSLSIELGALFDDLGCSPFDYEAYPPQSISRYTFWYSEFDIRQ